MNIAFDTYKQKLNDCRPALDGLADSLNIEGMRSELERLHAMQEAPGFWDDPEKSQKVAVKTRQTETKIARYEKMLTDWDDLMTICEMAAEEDDDSMLEELQNKENRQLIRRLVAEVLTEREADIVRRRYGLEGRLPQTQKQVAALYGISRSYVSRLEKKALAKLEEALQGRI